MWDLPNGPSPSKIQTPKKQDVSPGGSCVRKYIH